MSALRRRVRRLLDRGLRVVHLAGRAEALGAVEQGRGGVSLGRAPGFARRRSSTRRSGCSAPGRSPCRSARTADDRRDRPSRSCAGLDPSAPRGSRGYPITIRIRNARPTPTPIRRRTRNCCRRRWGPPTLRLGRSALVGDDQFVLFLVEECQSRPQEYDIQGAASMSCSRWSRRGCPHVTPTKRGRKRAPGANLERPWSVRESWADSGSRADRERRLRHRLPGLGRAAAAPGRGQGDRPRARRAAGDPRGPGRRQARATASIATLYELASDGDRAFLVCELIEGETLA